LIGYTAFIYLLEHVPVSKVISHSYINPVVAVILGILVLGERPQAAEFVGMAGVIVAVYLLTSARIEVKGSGVD
jgi:drug/metabolite transporter (DMT)-like permease